MEEKATKPRRKPSKRKPFIDLSNTIIPSSSLPSSQSSSSSSLLKPQTKSSLSLPLKSPLNKNPKSNLNSNSKSTATESITNDNVNNNKKEKEMGPSNKEKPSSMLSPLPKTSSASGVDCVGSEPRTVYNRRHTVEKRKGKGKEIAEPLSCSLETRMPDLRKKKYGDGDIGLSKSCPMPRKKKQRREKALPQDFIDKQRAYFAEVDAFELEEEVASADDLE
ncbi:hypothetical protein REPUB_Repub03eG0274500 [Reevesia pubescens]